MTRDEDDDDLSAVVPEGFARERPRRIRKELQPFSFDALKGEKVIVRAHGFTYRGVLVGVDEDEGDVYLRTEQQSLVLPLAEVSSIERDA